MWFFPVPSPQSVQPYLQGKLSVPQLPLHPGLEHSLGSAAGLGLELDLWGQIGPGALQRLSSVILGDSFHAPAPPASPLLCETGLADPTPQALETGKPLPVS